MSTIANARGLLGLLQLLQGPYASGQLLVRSTGPTGTLPKHSYGVPVVDGERYEEAIIKVEPNPAVADGSWPVTSAGVLVAATSVQGGNKVNRAAGTGVRWLPAIAGIEELSAVGPGGLTGGALLDTFGSLRQVKQYKDLGERDKAQAFFQAQVDDYPAAVLSWSRTAPADGSGSPSVGPTTRRVGRGKQLYVHEWNLWLITSRLDGEDLRRTEGDALRDDVLELLTDRTAYRGVSVSAPGIDITDARLESITATSFVDLVVFHTSFALKKRDTQVFGPWNTTRIRVERDGPGLVPDPLNVPDITVQMP